LMALEEDKLRKEHRRYLSLFKDSPFYLRYKLNTNNKFSSELASIRSKRPVELIKQLERVRLATMVVVMMMIHHWELPILMCIMWCRAC
jgi:hypothetical protein